MSAIIECSPKIPNNCTTCMVEGIKECIDDYKHLCKHYLGDFYLENMARDGIVAIDEIKARFDVLIEKIKPTIEAEQCNCATNKLKINENIPELTQDFEQKISCVLENGDIATPKHGKSRRRRHKRNTKPNELAI